MMMITGIMMMMPSAIGTGSDDDDSTSTTHSGWQPEAVDCQCIVLDCSNHSGCQWHWHRHDTSASLNAQARRRYYSVFSLLLVHHHDDDYIVTQASTDYDKLTSSTEVVRTSDTTVSVVLVLLTGRLLQ